MSGSQLLEPLRCRFTCTLWHLLLSDYWYSVTSPQWHFIKKSTLEVRVLTYVCACACISGSVSVDAAMQQKHIVSNVTSLSPSIGAGCLRMWDRENETKEINWRAPTSLSTWIMTDVCTVCQCIISFVLFTECGTSKSVFNTQLLEWHGAFLLPSNGTGNNIWLTGCGFISDSDELFLLL